MTSLTVPQVQEQVQDKVPFTHIELPELTPVEAAIMLAVSARPLTKTEVSSDQDAQGGVISLLQNHETMQKCNGNAKKIRALANDLQTSNMTEVL